MNKYIYIHIYIYRYTYIYIGDMFRILFDSFIRFNQVLSSDKFHYIFPHYFITFGN